MKNLKRFSALLLSLIMIFSLTACQSKTNDSFFGLIDNVGNWKEGPFVLEVVAKVIANDSTAEQMGAMGIDVGDSKQVSVGFKFDGTMSVSKNYLNAAISVKFNDSEYLDLTKVVFSDNIMYLNANKLVKSLLSVDVLKDFLNAQLSEDLVNDMVGEVDEIVKESEYIKFDLTDVNISSSSTFADIAKLWKDSALNKNISTVVKESILSIDPPAITKGKDSNYTMALNTENMKKVLADVTTNLANEAFATTVYDFIYSVAAYNNGELALNVYDSLCEFVDDMEVPEDDNNLKAIESSKVAIIKEIQASATEVESEPLPTGNLTVTANKDKKNPTVTILFADDTTSCEMKLAYSNTAVEIDVPKTAMSLEELQTALNGTDTIGSMLNGGVAEKNENANPDEVAVPPTVMGEDEWRAEYDIDIKDIKDSEMRKNVQEYVDKFKGINYDVSIDYNYGEYVVNGEGDLRFLSIGFDKNYKSETNPKMISVFRVSDYSEVSAEESYKMVSDAFNSLFNKELDKDLALGLISKESGNFTSTVYDESGSFNYSWMISDNVVRNFSASYYLDK